MERDTIFVSGTVSHIVPLFAMPIATSELKAHWCAMSALLWLTPVLHLSTARHQHAQNDNQGPLLIWVVGMLVLIYLYYIFNFILRRF